MPDSAINEQRPQTLERSKSGTFRIYLPDDQYFISHEKSKRQRQKENVLIMETKQTSDQEPNRVVKNIETKESVQVQPKAVSPKRSTTAKHSSTPYKNKRETNSPLTVKKSIDLMKTDLRKKLSPIIPLKHKIPRTGFGQCCRETVLTKSTSDQNLSMPKKPAHATPPYITGRRNFVKSMEITPKVSRSVVVEPSSVKTPRPTIHQLTKPGPDIDVESIYYDNLGKAQMKGLYTREKMDVKVAEHLATAPSLVLDVAPCTSSDKKAPTDAQEREANRTNTSPKFHSNDRQFSISGGFGFGGGGGGGPLENRPLSSTAFDGNESSGSCGQGSGPMLISGGRIVNDDSMWQADVFIEGGAIKQIGHNLQVPPGCKVIDARGKYVIPGGIDPHVHFNLPMFGNVKSVDDFYTGTKAAVAGGTTMIIDFVTPNSNESLISAYEKYRNWADPNVCCDYGLSVIVRNFNERTKNEMQEITKNRGVNSFKFFMAYAGAFQLNDQELYQSFVQCRRIGAMARVHAECGDLIFMKEKELLSQGVTGPEGHFQARPEECQSEATLRACLLAKEANCPLYVVHVMSKGAADAIGDARRKGAVVFGEAVGSGLSGVNGSELFDHCFRHAAAHVMSPPLSSDTSTATHLMDSLAAGQLQTTGSDHAVFDSNQKALGKNDFTKIPNGVNGVEERMMIIWEKGVNCGKIDPMRFVAVTSSTAAKLFNIYPKKGRIAVDSDADIVVWDPEAQRTLSSENHVSKGDFNIFEGITCTGCPSVTISRGEVVYENEQLNTIQGSGRFIPMAPFAPAVFGSIEFREKSRQPIKIDRTASSISNGPAKNVNGIKAPTPMKNGVLLAQTTSQPPALPSIIGVGQPTSAKNASLTSTPNSTPSVTSPSSTATSFDDIPVGGKFSAMHISQQHDFHARPATKAGGRNLQDSSFNLSGAQIYDEQSSRRSTKISKPPGGESSGLW